MLLGYQAAAVVAERPQHPTPIVVSNAYQTHALQLRLEAAAGVDRLEMIVIVAASPGQCLLVDDIVLTRE